MILRLECNVKYLRQIEFIDFTRVYYNGNLMESIPPKIEMYRKIQLWKIKLKRI